MRLYINIDHVATVRQARRTDEPDPVEAALAAERAGADGITAHLREDRRHIQDTDIRSLAERVTTVLNFELAVSEDIVGLAEELAPFQATLVPERREEITTEGGLALGTSGDTTDSRLREVIDRLSARNVRVSLFIDPSRASIDRCIELAVPAVELHTGPYAHTYRQSDESLQELQVVAKYGKDAGLAIHAGHGLTYRNVQPVAAIGDIEELNIGHSIVSQSISTGMERAVREMRGLVDAAR